MRTQSIDTHPAIERIMIEMIRRASMSKRFGLVQSLTESTRWSNIHAWQESHHDATEQEATLHFVACFYGNLLAQQVATALTVRERRQVQSMHLISIMRPILHAFKNHRVPYYVGGSIASSLHGMQQLAQDIDLVVDLPEHALPSLLTLFQQYYICDENSIRQAVQERTSFVLFHLDSLTKFDIILEKSDIFNTSMCQLVTEHMLNEQDAPVPVASAYEMILWKLRRYHRDAYSRNDGMRDDAEWNDILGMLKVQGPTLDLAYLRQWAATLNVRDLLERAFVDSGLTKS